VAKAAGTALANIAVCGNVGLLTASGTSKAGGKGKTVCSEYQTTSKVSQKLLAILIKILRKGYQTICIIHTFG
jgi:hypothetical protein